MTIKDTICYLKKEINEMKQTNNWCWEYLDQERFLCRWECFCGHTKTFMGWQVVGNGGL